jgi:hypothetical protein
MKNAPAYTRLYFYKSQFGWSKLTPKMLQNFFLPNNLLRPFADHPHSPKKDLFSDHF